MYKEIEFKITVKLPNFVASALYVYRISKAARGADGRWMGEQKISSSVVYLLASEQNTGAPAGATKVMKSSPLPQDASLTHFLNELQYVSSAASQLGFSIYK